MELHKKNGENTELGDMYGATPVALDAKNADVDAAVAATAGLKLCGWSVRESAGTPAVATVAIIHGATVAGGSNLAHIELAANGSETVWLGSSGVLCANGLSIDINAGTVDIVLYVKQVFNG